MNLFIVKTIAIKELVETLRDKRTLMAMVGVPLLLYPLMLLAGTQAIMFQQGKVEAKDSRVFVQADLAETIQDWVAAVERIQIVSVDGFEGQSPEAALKALRAGDLDALVYGHVSGGETGTVSLTIAYDSTVPASSKARQRLRRGLNERGDELLTQRLDEAGLPESFTQPLAVEGDDVAPPKKRAGSALGSMLPVMMIVMLGVGAFYPAVDLTAGEKERGTFETLLSTPTSRAEMVCGKFLTVLGLSIFTGLLNLASMAATIGFQLAQMKGGGGGEEGFSLASLQLSLGDVASMGLILLPLALMIASIMMAVALMARDFKEASNYMSPFFILIVLPAAYAALPGSELDGAMLFVPIANVALLFKGLLMETATLPQVFLVFMSTAAYAMLSLQLAVWMFQREDVILAEEKGIPLSLRRSQFEPRGLPTPGISLLVFALCLLLFFYLGTYSQGKNLIGGLIFTQWGLLALPPLVLLWFIRVDLKKAMSFNLPRPGAIAGVLLMAPGAMVLVQQLSFWISKIIPPSGLESQMMPVIESTPLWLLLFAIAVSPGICEEILFRGAVLSGLRSKLKPWVAVLLTGLLFGLFHISLDRVPPTAILGILISYICLRSGSILPSMLYHVLHNGSLVLLAKQAVPTGLLSWLETSKVEENGYPPVILAASVGLVVAGVLVMEFAGKRSSAEA